MNPVIMLVYGAAVLAAVGVLALKRASRWYWHLLGIVAALALGLTPIPPSINNNTTTVIIGVIFLFLMVWGIGAPFFPRRARG